MGHVSRAWVAGAIVATVASVACAPAIAGTWAGEYRVLVLNAEQKGSGTYHQDSSGACTATADGSGNEDVVLAGVRRR